MKILVTGSAGFVGKNLCEALKCIRDGKDRRSQYQAFLPLEVFEYNKNSTLDELDFWASQADLVFNFAGVNRPENPSEFMEGNRDFLQDLLEVLKRHKNYVPVVLSSSAQASLQGRFEGSLYGESKLAAEKLLRSYSACTGAFAYIYRFPNVFGKWCRPNYNSAVATFCNNIANGLPVQIDDPATELELLYIDDLIEEMLLAALGKPHYCNYDGLQPLEVKECEVKSQPWGARENEFCYVPTTHTAALGQIIEFLQDFHDQSRTLVMPPIPEGSFQKKLYSTYVSYLPREKAIFDLKMNKDERGSFTELVRTQDCGQFSVNISKPGITKGQHWHNSKWEFFIVVAGHGLIQERRIGSDEVLEFKVSGERIQAVHMLPGYTHNIINLSDTEPLITVMWANESFDPQRPDTFYEEV